MKDLENVYEYQRQHERHKMLHSVQWTHNNSENNLEKIRDISSSGIFLASLGIMKDHIQCGDSLLVVTKRIMYFPQRFVGLE